MADVPNILKEQLEHEHRFLPTILSGGDAIFDYISTSSPLPRSFARIPDHVPVAPTRAATPTSQHPLRDHATKTTAVMALLKSRLPFQEQATQSQVQAQQVAPTTSSLRAHTASVNVYIDTATTSTQPFRSAKLPPSSQEELVLLHSLMQKEIADLTADRSEPQRLRSFRRGGRG